jgi:adenine-specific DNA-methyltransferase
MVIENTWRSSNAVTLYPGKCEELIAALGKNSVDLVLTSPPYCIGKAYEDKKRASDFVTDHKAVLPKIVEIVKPGGSICWQVGYHVSDGVAVPLDYIVYEILSHYPEIKLRNRIVWTFGHGLHSSDRFSGRHETLLWFTKGDDYEFHLDVVRVPQKYPGKRHYKGESKGQLSGNPKGKNPGDVWDIPNVKANHVEKTEHPCQFPIALAQRVIKAMTRPGFLVFDPYVGSGTTGAAAILLNRRFVGAEIDKKYLGIAERRLAAAIDGTLPFREIDKPIYQPPPNSPLTAIPSEWKNVAA